MRNSSFTFEDGPAPGPYDGEARGRVRALRDVIRHQEQLIRFMNRRCDMTYPDDPSAEELRLMQRLDARYRAEGADDA